MEAPIFKIIIDELDEESGFIRNSFVRNPAVEVERFAFDSATKRMIFDEDKKQQMFTSVSILADTPIERVAPDGSPFFVVFTKEVIRQIRNKLTKEGKSNEVSLYHDENEVQKGIYMVESFIVEKGRVESPLFNIPDGSLVTSYWVESKEQFEELLVDENFNGFSIEINAKISEMFSNSFDTIYSEDKIVQEVKAIAFREDITDEEKEKLIKKIIEL